MDLHQTAIEIGGIFLLAGIVGIALNASFWRSKKNDEKREQDEWDKVFARHSRKRRRK